MDKYEKLVQLQKLKDGGSISQEEFEIEKNKILNENTKKKMPIWLCIIIALIITIGIIAFFGSMAENDFNQKSNEYVQSIKNKYPSDISDNTYNNSNNTSTKSGELIGKHNLIYVDGIDISSYNGYLELNSDGTFKIYAKSKNISMELMNIEGTYTVSSDTISIKVTKEGGYDLGSRTYNDTITIASDNLAYLNMKFSK